MATINTKQQASEPIKGSVILRNIGISLNTSKGYALLALDEDSYKAITDLYDIKVDEDNVALVNISRFLRVSINKKEVDDVSTASGKGWANVKLRIADYDYTYRGKKGHTTKWELVGIYFKSFTGYDALADLDDGDEAPDDDLPF